MHEIKYRVGGTKHRKEKRYRSIVFLVAVLVSFVVITSVVAIVLLKTGRLSLVSSNDEPEKPIDNCGTQETTEEKGLLSRIVPINSEELKYIFEMGSYDYDKRFLVIGRPTCPACSAFFPILNDVIEEKKIDVYYYNTDDARNADSEALSSVLETLNISGVPTLIYLVGGSEYARLDNYESRAIIEDFVEEYSNKEILFD
jgi:hypothetical protein